MHNGNLEQVGTPFEIYRKPATRFVAEFLGHANFFQAQDAKYFAGESNGLPPLRDSQAWIIRPEHLTLRTASWKPEAGQCSITAKVIDCVFLGSEWMLKFSFLDSGSYFVKIPGQFSKGEIPAEFGDEVVLSWNRDDVWTVD